mmetsp:Transcript_13818/g.49051  ORF Transcript_13818/g.49051 Transcript_13818/m.49051 type:complete len:391 (+) Transcript_13818:1141-2313(+)
MPCSATLKANARASVASTDTAVCCTARASGPRPCSAALESLAQKRGLTLGPVLLLSRALFTGAFASIAARAARASSSPAKRIQSLSPRATPASSGGGSSFGGGAVEARRMFSAPGGWTEARRMLVCAFVTFAETAREMPPESLRRRANLVARSSAAPRKTRPGASASSAAAMAAYVFMASAMPPHASATAPRFNALRPRTDPNAAAASAALLEAPLRDAVEGRPPSTRRRTTPRRRRPSTREESPTESSPFIKGVSHIVSENNKRAAGRGEDKGEDSGLWTCALSRGLSRGLSSDLSDWSTCASIHPVTLRCSWPGGDASISPAAAAAATDVRRRLADGGLPPRSASSMAAASSTSAREASSKSPRQARTAARFDRHAATRNRPRRRAPS